MRSLHTRHIWQVMKPESDSLAFEYAQQRYDVGVMNALDFNTAKNNLARVQSERLRAKYDYIFRAKVLDFYRGKALTFAPQ